MAVFWMSLQADWTLQNVQAGINVIVTVLSFLATFVYVRYCWQRTAKSIARGRAVPLHTLLNVNTVGEVLDVVLLLRRKLISQRYAHICAQCSVVLILSMTAIFSGVIARYCTKRELVIRKQDVPGSLAWRGYGGYEYGNVEWNNTYQRLESAAFPQNQLADFLPNNSIDWVFQPSQWNNSWSFDCQYTSETSLQLEANGNCSGALYELPGLENAFSYSKWRYYVTHNGGTHEHHEWKDNMMFIYGSKQWDYDLSQNVANSMSVLLAFVYMHNVPAIPENVTDMEDCLFYPGKIGSAAFTKAECELRCTSETANIPYTAGPDTSGQDLVLLPKAYLQYYFARFVQQSTSNSSISMIAPDELSRFYQAYTIAKDTQYNQPVTRSLSVEVPVVQLSTVFLALAILVALLILLGLTSHIVFATRHSHIMSTTPQSKIDWMLQSIEAEDRPCADVKSRLRRNVTVDSIAHLSAMPHAKRLRAEFETARYGGRQTSTLFLSDSSSSTDQDGGSMMCQGGNDAKRFSSLRAPYHGTMPGLSRWGGTDVVYSRL